jgi:hypothetical protein
MQYSDAPDEIKSPSLSDAYRTASTFTATLDAEATIDCIGIGYTDATEVYIYGASDSDMQTITITQDAPYHNGLYLLDAITHDSFTISHNGNFIGRVGIGTARTLNTNRVKEIGFYTTNESRVTLSGQTIPGAGGYNGRRFDADVRYEIDATIYADILAAYTSQIMKAFPYFIYTHDEQHKLPATMLHFYAATDKPLTMLQSSTYKFLYSYKFQFYERF